MDVVHLNQKQLAVRWSISEATPNEKWLTDITEFQIPADTVYLSPMIDCFDGMVVSRSIGTRPNAELVNTMLDAAIEEFIEALDAYIRWYNEARIKISLGSRSPSEHRRELGIAV